MKNNIHNGSGDQHEFDRIFIKAQGLKLVPEEKKELWQKIAQAQKFREDSPKKVSFTVVEAMRSSYFYRTVVVIFSIALIFMVRNRLLTVDVRPAAGAIPQKTIHATGAKRVTAPALAATTTVGTSSPAITVPIIYPSNPGLMDPHTNSAGALPPTPSPSHSPQ
jgi:hypothetical protein